MTDTSDSNVVSIHQHPSALESEAESQDTSSSVDVAPAQVDGETPPPAPLPLAVLQCESGVQVTKGPQGEAIVLLVLSSNAVPMGIPWTLSVDAAKEVVHKLVEALSTL